MITVITQNTDERNQELQQLYKECKPIMTETGCNLREAVQQIKKTNHNKFTNRAWYKELLKIAKKDGYTGR